MKLRVFVASSVEGLGVAYAVQENLEYDFEITVWPQGVFALSKSTIEALDEQSRRFDAAIFVFSADDIVIARGEEKHAVRDNVLFELGLFVGRLGRDKCFILKPRSFDTTHFPSDLFGVTPGAYDDARSDGNLVAALGPACNKVRRALVPTPPTPTPAPTPTPGQTLREFLLSQPFRLYFNPPKRWKRIVFGAGGEIVEGNNKNEHAWRLVGDKLELVQLDGKIHSRFNYVPSESAFKHTNEADTLSIRDQVIVPDSRPEARTES